MRTVLAWGDNVGFWDVLGHGIGAFATSPGFAGLAAVVGASIAARQVKITRDHDERARRQQRQDEEDAREKEAASLRQNRLWERFVWVTEQASTQGPETMLSLLEVVEEQAKQEGDEPLLRLIEQQQFAAIKDMARRIDAADPGEDEPTSDDPEQGDTGPSGGQEPQAGP